MDFKDELVDVGSQLIEKVSCKVIFTTNVRDEKDLSMSEQDDYKEIKEAWMGPDAKALTVRMNDDTDEGRERTAFETVAHLFAFTKTTSTS